MRLTGVILITLHLFIDGKETMIRWSIITASYSGCRLFQQFQHSTKADTPLSFPIQEHGVNYQAQSLQPHEIEAMTADEEIIERVIKSYRLMLDFYGMQLQTPDTGLLTRTEPASKCRKRYQNLLRELHLRLS